MTVKFNKRLLVAWAVLAALTSGYLVMDRSATSTSAIVTSSVIVIALIKVRIIFREFMEVRHAPALLSRLTDAWVLLIAAGLFGSYFIGLAIN
ncbi:cytochrome C oxidase subunit IV family protein [Mycobacterium asiaticum]|uniref:Prokaryotic cytochrome C oxidase subunit IV family protein n=1 Tax=Mycobacterium asiaticum TaxID=1790 RepID=A0A1A3NCB8_MYCAS|nr:cytochrome C oxidase subunit IV family protein [Mycobacterium asiaticum]OBK18729.1 hypothetical protein A5636_02335 [Mycobacterium asiaticum]